MDPSLVWRGKKKGSLLSLFLLSFPAFIFCGKSPRGGEKEGGEAEKAHQNGCFGLLPLSPMDSVHRR